MASGGESLEEQIRMGLVNKNDQEYIRKKGLKTADDYTRSVQADIQAGVAPPAADNAAGANAAGAAPPRQKLGRISLSTDAINRRYELARQRAQGQEASQMGQVKDALARRQAQLGGGPSGAFLKLEQQAQDESAKRLGQVNEGLTAAEGSETEQLKNFETQLNVAREEAEAGRDFAALEAEAARKWQTGERLSGQEFAAHQAKLSRDLSESQFAANMDRDWQKFLHEKEVDAFNMDLATKTFNEKDILEQALGGILEGAGIPGMGGGNKILQSYGGSLIGGPLGAGRALLGGGGGGGGYTGLGI